MTPEQALQVKALRTRSDRSEIFNYVIDHLRKQGERSILASAVDAGEVVCAYRGAEGTMCAVGALITDDEYDREWEGRGVARLAGERDLPASLRERLSPHVAMLIDLQRFHDNFLGSPDAFEHGRFSERVEEILLYLREDWDIQ